MEGTQELNLEAGTVLAGKYRVDRILGQGGMGVVVEARHLALDERVALKFLLPEYASHPEASARFLREARAAVKIKSEHVARVSDVGTLESGAPYMVMEFLNGSDLSQELEKRGTFRLDDAVDYILQGCEALAEAHSYGIVHRDLKPANLFLSRNVDGTPLVKVLDFGISKVMSGDGVDNLTKTTAAMGSALYMSPEQMQSTRSVDQRTDIYALGVALYEMLAGKQPFYAETLPQLCAEILTGTPTPIRTIRPDLPEGFARALEKAYARDRDQRYQSIAELAIALAPWAPQRSQGSIEKVARMAGVAPPPADQGRASFASIPAVNGPGDGGGAGGTMLLPGPYQGPTSARAAASFATDNGMSTTNGMAAPPSRSAAPIVAIAALLVVAVGGAAAYFVVLPRMTTAPTVAAGTTATELVTPPPPVVTASATTVASVDPPVVTASASADAPPTDAPTAEPTAAATNAAIKTTRPTVKTKPATTATPTTPTTTAAAPTAKPSTTTPKDLFGER